MIKLTRIKLSDKGELECAQTESSDYHYYWRAESRPSTSDVLRIGPGVLLFLRSDRTVVGPQSDRSDRTAVGRSD